MAASENSENSPLVLVDGSSYLYRAFFASQQADLRNAAGEPTGAIRVMVSMLRSLMKDYPQSQIAVIFDAKGKSFRNDLYPEYKANRSAMPDDLRSQVAAVHACIRAMGLPLLIEEGVEADDVIGTLALQATESKLHVLISTGDKDMAQLVTEHVELIDTMKNVRTNIAGVEEKFGVPPELIIDYLALRGDTSDNIPGVPGVGEKTAIALLQGLGSIKDIYASLDKVPALGFRGSKTMPKKLEENREMAELSYKLATIKTDVPLDVHVSELKQTPQDDDALLDLFKQYEFRSWIRELEEYGSAPAGGLQAGAPQEQAATKETEYETILTEAQFERWLGCLNQVELFAFDTETTSLDYMQADLVGLSFSVEPYRAGYLPLTHDYMGAPEQLDRKWVLDRLKPLLEDESRKKVGQNLKYDKSVLARHGITLRGIAFDTMLESYVWNSTATRHNMDALAEKYLDHTTIHYEDIAGKGVKQLTFNQIELDKAAPYAAEDADITLRLHQELWPKIEADSDLKQIFEDIELPLVPVLSQVERNGALVDANLLGKQSLELAERLEKLEKEAYEIAGEEFNLASPKQLQALLFEKLELPVLKKTPKGAPSTVEEVLQELALDYPLPRIILEHRSLSKLKSTYTDKLPQLINPETGRIHTSYHQAVTATGRLSSSDPNLQNIPIRTEKGRRIRQAFVAPEGYKLVAADYSQIELRIMAHLSGDDGLLTAFRNGQDVHRATAAEVFGVTPEQVTSDQRRSAKAINFGLIYGMSAFGLAKQLGITRQSAQEYVDLYFQRYPGVQDYMERTRALAHDKGYVETLFGRRLHLPEINARNKMRQQAAERTAINAPMQGTAADIIKHAMMLVDQWLKESGLDARMIMQVHDELVLEVAEKDLDAVSLGLKQQMEAATELAVPLEVEVGTGNNWDEAH
ncbi:DNA polymerase I [Spongorhabdus nitratireducens]